MFNVPTAMPAPLPLKLIDSLNNTPPETVVRVVVRPSAASPNADIARTIDPRQFASQVEYRSALIARQKQHTQPDKDLLVAKARALGLDASAAEAVNAVLVEGKVGRVLHLLREGDFESAVLDSPLAL